MFLNLLFVGGWTAVPAYLDPPKIIPVGPVDTTTVLTAAQKQNNQRTNIVEDKPRLIGTGTLEDPIDLTGRVPNSVTELIIQSQSTCASVKHDLQWRCENSFLTWQALKLIPGTLEDEVSIRIQDEMKRTAHVPAYLDPPKIIPVGPADTTTVLTAAQIQNNQRTNIVEDKPRLIGTGTLEDPIDLTGRVPNSVTELIIQSQSTCASVKHDLQWRCENSTRSFSLRPSVVQAIPDTGTRRLGTLSFAPQLPCPNGLYSITGQVRIGCDSRMKTSSSSDRGTRENALVGLNRIKCTPNHGRDQAFIDQTFSREAANLYAQRISSMQLTSSGFYDDCLPIDPTQRNKQRSACVYVLCPGPVEPWFTLSERVAIAVSVPVFILLCLLLCYVTQRRRRSKQKSNLAPGQNHEIELML
ncbi:hypothetical protein T265_03626 [Opisthorchis viverrini]|uniref:Uncharacterized protein n=1 Tax=Opisthorchis viverrini TaxID=6198 RepID=A0A074ZVD9_OPIVI|nr:hypothetical protein T265_03626 [Opisthorchis viverrini]KER29832.1 hypothetical protein T265_03626 [Opisthorchis viverrini]